MIIERVWRTIGESAIAMLITSSLLEIYWQEARSTACYLYNRSSGAHQEISMLSSYEQYYGVVPHVLHFKIFGSKCYATVLNKANGDHSPKAVKGIFVGYQDQYYIKEKSDVCIVRLVIPVQNGLDISVDATIYQKSESLS